MTQASNEGPIEPDPDAVEIMAQVDAMPKAWRLLVYEFGLVIVRAHREERYSADNAFMSLMMRQERKQLEYAKPFPPGRIYTIGRRWRIW